MEKDTVVKKLIEIIQEVQSAIDDEKPVITGGTRPVGGLACFDSLVGACVTGECKEKFNLKQDIQSLFVGSDSKGILYALSVDEIADRIIELSKKGEQ